MLRAAARHGSRAALRGFWPCFLRRISLIRVLIRGYVIHTAYSCRLLRMHAEDPRDFTVASRWPRHRQCSLRPHSAASRCSVGHAWHGNDYARSSSSGSLPPSRCCTLGPHGRCLQSARLRRSRRTGEPRNRHNKQQTPHTCRFTHRPCLYAGRNRML